MNENKKKLSARIELRVTAIEKEKVQAKAGKCGLSTTEYVNQRAWGTSRERYRLMLFLLVLKCWASLGIKRIRRNWTKKFARY